MTTLPDVADLVYGFAFSSSEFRDGLVSDGLPVVRIRDVVPGFSNTTYIGEYDPTYLVNDGDILIGMDGEFNIARWRGGRALLNQRVCKVVPRLDKVEPRYLFWVLPKELKAIEDRTPFVTVKHLSAKALGAINLVMPPLSEQRRIADILDKADAIHRKRREALALTEELLRSAFLEMFGDPVTNSKGWPITVLGDEATEMKYGTSEKSGSESQDAFPVLRIPNVVRGEIDWSDLKYGKLSPREADGLRLRKGDLLVVRTNGNPDYVGRCAVYDSERTALFASYLIRVRTDENRLHPAYVQAALSSASYRARLTAEARTTAGNYNISTEGLRRLRLPVPPLAEQQRFASLCIKIRGSRDKHRWAEQHAEALFAALDWRALGAVGNLTC